MFVHRRAPMFKTTMVGPCGPCGRLARVACATATSLVMSPFFAGVVNIRETTCIVLYFGYVVPEDSLVHLSVPSGKALTTNTACLINE